MQHEGDQNNTYNRFGKISEQNIQMSFEKKIWLFHFQTGAKMYPGPEIQHAQTRSHPSISLKQNILL